MTSVPSVDGQGLWSQIISPAAHTPTRTSTAPVCGARHSAPSSRSGPSASIVSPRRCPKRHLSRGALFPPDDHQHLRPKLYRQEAHLEEHQERQYPREALRHLSGPALMHVMHTPHPTPPTPFHLCANPIHYCSLRTPNYTTQLPKAGAARAPRLCGNWGIPPPSQDSPSGYTFHTR